MLTLRALPHIFLLLFLAVVVSGCSLAGGIFEAGFWTGIILVAIIAIGLTLLFAKMKS
jgi:hypothetical protein